MKMLVMETRKHPKVFITDDDVITLNLFVQQLKNIGITDVTPFVNGHNCLNSLCFNPDIIFLDHNMDLLDGLELLKKIKRTNPKAYVVMISGQDNVDVVVNCYRYGAFDYIIKDSNQEYRIKQVIDKIQRDQLSKKNRFSFLRFLDRF